MDPSGVVSGTFRFTGDGLLVQAPGQPVSGAARGVFEARGAPPSTFARLGVDLGLGA